MPVFHGNDAANGAGIIAKKKAAKGREDANGDREPNRSFSLRGRLKKAMISKRYVLVPDTKRDSYGRKSRKVHKEAGKTYFIYPWAARLRIHALSIVNSVLMLHGIASESFSLAKVSDNILDLHIGCGS